MFEVQVQPASFFATQVPEPEDREGAHLQARVRQGGQVPHSPHGQRHHLEGTCLCLS